MKAATVRAFLLVLTGRLTRYDVKQSQGKYHNPYALSHYLEAVHKTEAMLRKVLDRDDPEAMDLLLNALKRNFIFERGRFALPPVNQVAKMMQQWTEGGRMPKYSSLRSRAVKLAYDNPGEIRDALLPILAKTASKIPPQFLANIKGKKKDGDKDDESKDEKAKSASYYGLEYASPEEEERLLREEREFRGAVLEEAADRVKRLLSQKGRVRDVSKKYRGLGGPRGYSPSSGYDGPEYDDTEAEFAFAIPWESEEWGKTMFVVAGSSASDVEKVFLWSGFYELNLRDEIDGDSSDPLKPSQISWRTLSYTPEDAL